MPILDHDKNLEFFQRESVEFITSRPENAAMLCDETGLGKTRTSVYALDRWDAGPSTLITTMKLPIYSWVREISAAFPEAGIFIHSGTPKQRDAAWIRFMMDESTNPYGQRFFITNHYFADEIVSMRADWDNVIVDEAHHLKNADTILWRAIKKTRRDTLILPTATPQSQGPRDLWAYFNLCDSDEYPSFWEFAHRQCIKIPSEFGIKWGGPRRPKEIRAMLKKHMVRHLWKNVLPHISSRRIPLKIKPTATQMRLYNDLELTGMTSDLSTILKIPAELQLRARQILLTPKLIGSDGPSATLEAMKDWLKDLMVPCVIFVPFKEAIPHIASYIPKIYTQRVVIHGGMPHDKLFARVEEFETSKEQCRVLICTSQLGTGFDINSAAHSLTLGFTWTSFLEEQKEGRLTRLGGNVNAFHYYIVNEDTVDEVMWSAIDDQHDWNAQTINHEEVA